MLDKYKISSAGFIARRLVLFAHILQLYKDCVGKWIWAKLIFETRGGGDWRGVQFLPHSQKQPLQQQQLQQQMDALTGRAIKNALPTGDGGNELGGDGRPG
jgi:hypothetical protein